MTKINFKNKNIVITGSTGFIGKAVSEKYAELNANLILIDLKQKLLLEQKRKLEKKYRSNIYIFNVDFNKVVSIRKIANKISNILDNIDVVINIAAMVGDNKIKGWNEDFEKQSFINWSKATNVNLTAIFYLSQLLKDKLENSLHPNIINLSSIYGFLAPDYNLYKDLNMNNPAAYSATKAGVIQLTKWLASALAPKIRVNCISPGGIKRKNLKKIFIRRYENKTLLNRMCTEDDVVNTIIFLSSELSSYITGQNLILDGGYSIK